ncbi:MAG: hypothetical protein ACYTBR_11930 [Planctomycetota bacterium]
MCFFSRLTTTLESDGVVSPELVTTIWPPPVRMFFVSPSVTVTVKEKSPPSTSASWSAVLVSDQEVRSSHTGSVNVVGQLHVSRSRLAGLRRPTLPLLPPLDPAGTGTLRVATVAAAAVIHSGLNILTFMWRVLRGCSPPLRRRGLTKTFFPGNVIRGVTQSASG